MNFVLFADDTTLFYEHAPMEDLEEVHVVNSEFKKLAEWLKTNRLFWNVFQSCSMPFNSLKSKIVRYCFQSFATSRYVYIELMTF